MNPDSQVGHISLLALPHALGSTLTIPLEMLSAANDMVRASRKAQTCPDLELVSVAEPEMQLMGGMEIRCQRQLTDIRSSDLVFVPGLWGNPRRFLHRYPELSPWLRQRYSEGSVLCSFTTGSHFLAAAGLLDGKVATTHWRFFDQFQQLFPKVRLQRKRFITRADSLYCTGSVNAARDIMLHFIAGIHGQSIADQVAHQFTHELKPSHESLLLAQDQRDTHHDELIIKIQDWMRSNYAQPITVDAMSTRFRLSVRSLNRRFRAASDITPSHYLQQLRIEQAQALLKASNLSIAEVADRVGYQDASYFSGIFRRWAGVSPREYRRLVRAKLFAVAEE
jgi:transcriptional regulator GlxA family with amidase domain